MDSGRGIPDGNDDDNTVAPGAMAPTTTATTATTNATTTTTTTSSSSSSSAGSGGQIAWKADEKILNSLTGMGINSITARKALYYTKNISAEAAIEWIFENQNADLDTPLEIELRHDVGSNCAIRRNDEDGDEDEDDQDDGNDDDDLYKMIFVVNAELSMGVGKIAAQVAHAAIGLHRILLQHQAKYGESLLAWAEYGETKIVLRGDTTEHLISLEHKAINQNLPCYLVHDAGKTQVRAGSTTVLAIFGPNVRVDKVTGLLKLY